MFIFRYLRIQQKYFELKVANFKHIYTDSDFTLEIEISYFSVLNYNFQEI